VPTLSGWLHRRPPLTRRDAGGPADSEVMCSAMETIYFRAGDVGLEHGDDARLEREQRANRLDPRPQRTSCCPSGDDVHRRRGWALTTGKQVLWCSEGLKAMSQCSEAPIQVDCDRNADRHFALGKSPHCLGSHLACRALRVAIKGLDRRIPDRRVVRSAGLDYRPGARQIDHFPLVFGGRG